MNNQIVKVGNQDIDLTEWNGKAIQAERTAAAIEITTDEEDSMAVDSLAEITRFKRGVESARKTEVEPFNLLVKKINDIFRPISESLDAAESVIKGKRKFYLQEKERVRQEEEGKRLAEYQAKIEAEKKKAEAEHREVKIVTPPPVILPSAPTTRGESGTSTAKKFWNYEVTDIAALYKARPDLVKIEQKPREILAAVKVDQSIPGLRIFEDIQISSR
jgi:hypothetical protein